MEILIGVVGGLGLFLYGMQIMGNGLQKAAGKRLERIIEILTTNRFMAVFVGMIVTGVIQSSSATTVMVVGFVNAGIMKLTQAVGIIMGANIGTTITGQIISMSISDIAPISIGLGMILWMTAKSDKTKTLAEIFIGLGILFFGMEFLKDSLKPLRELQAFNTLMADLGHHPFLGVLIGFALTFVVQSSSASIGMLIALASQGILPLEAALPILYGDNIGTCTTALLSSLGASRNAKRAAIMHLTFNAIGTLLFVVFLTGPITSIVTSWDPTDVGRQIANAHTIFNLSNVAIQLPFAGLLVKFVLWLVPERDDEKSKKKTKYLDERMMETPSIALTNVIKETLHMGDLAKQSINDAMVGYFDNNSKSLQKVLDNEKTVNALERDITNYLVDLSNKDISVSDRKYIDGLFNSINDIERIGDHAENIAEIFVTLEENKLPLSEDSKGALKVMFEKTIKTFELALAVIHTPEQYNIDEVLTLEKEMDELERKARAAHFDRLHHNACHAESGVYYLEIVNNLERISDLSCNLVRVVADTTKVA